MRVVIQDNYEKMCKWAADYIAAKINAHKEDRPFVLGLPTGSSPIGVYKELVKKNKAGELSFARATSVNLDEYYPIAPDNDQSYRYFMNHHLFDHVDIDKNKTHVPCGTAKDPAAEGARYEAMIDALGGVDVQVLGIGQNGHIGFNEPDEALVMDTHVTNLTESTIRANSRFFASENDVPRQALTMGIGSIFKAKKVLLMAAGKEKKAAVNALLSRTLTTKTPASLLNLHPDVTLICTEDAIH